jgi:uncharacterized integral membrane protein
MDRRDGICTMCGGTGRNIEGDYCPACGARVSYGRGRNRKEIFVHGTDHSEVSKVARDLMKHQDAHPLLLLLTHWSFWFATLLAVLGVVLVVIGSTGQTEFVFFGQAFKSQNVGIAAFFLVGVIVVLNVRRILKSLDRNK